MMTQRGNVLFLILIAVALFAALSIAVTESMSGGGKNASSEKAKVDASKLREKQIAIDQAVARLKFSNGCTDAQISYETPDGENENPNAPEDESCHVYSASGGGVQAPADSLPSEGSCAESLAIGASCDVGGITIAYIGDSGGNRLYTTLTDLLNQYSWNDGSTDYTDTYVTGTTDGLQNTDDLIGTSDAGAPYEAAAACRALGADWYLPALQEAQDVQANHDTGDLSGSFELYGGWYWMSSEFDDTRARRFNFTGDNDNLAAKETEYYVRCFRR